MRSAQSALPRRARSAPDRRMRKSHPRSAHRMLPSGSRAHRARSAKSPTCFDLSREGDRSQTATAVRRDRTQRVLWRRRMVTPLGQGGGVKRNERRIRDASRDTGAGISHCSVWPILSGYLECRCTCRPLSDGTGGAPRCRAPRRGSSRRPCAGASAVSLDDAIRRYAARWLESFADAERQGRAGSREGLRATRMLVSWCWLSNLWSKISRAPTKSTGSFPVVCSAS